MFSEHINKIIGFSAAIFGLVAFLAAQYPVELFAGPYAGVEITKPPWLFFPLYQLEDWFGVVSLVIFPIIVVIGLVLLPFIDKNVEHIKTRRIVVWSYLILITLMMLFIINIAVLPPVQHLGN